MSNLVDRLSRWGFSHRLVLRVTATAAAFLQVGFLLQAVSRGLDYVLLPRNAPSEAVLSVIEQALPLWLSGWIFIVAGAMIAIGLVMSHWPFAALGHFVLAVLYAGFAAGALIEVWSRDDVFGWRTGTGWIVATLVHYVFSRASETAWRVARADRKAASAHR